ncbi:peptidylprolyl isomerase [Seongchinamella unica]|uniref:Peptidylprolyl isomerase n=1 Tax=Seongchinamella unica TaxID=2547392 RepID=A0A4V2ZX95_9GAMM|nr:fatty acid cis/trans isomerase [Seongchinamella unica]TDG13784.1 peptidylprolyl isomerase [Seongchinamella unica]
MHSKFIIRGGIFLFVVLAVATLAYLTQEEEPDCSDLRQDLTAAVLADSAGDQDALTNRAILMRGACGKQGKSAPGESTPGESTPGENSDTPAADESGTQTETDKPGMSPLSKSTPLEPSPGSLILETPMEILEHRCIVCHGCYDAPCQLKLEAMAGLERGANKDLVYDGSRLIADNMTRLFDDALTEEGWREKGFYPVMDDANPSRGVMYRMLQLKQAHPLPTEGPMPKGFDFSLYRDQQCPTAEEFDAYASEKPLWGMPYGLPGLNSEEHSTLSDWLLAGAPQTPPAPLDADKTALLERWESFLNQPDLRHQLIARYIYEHLFLATLYLDSGDEGVWFRLVRSRTGPGKPLDLIATRRPYDDPGVKRVYYRLQRMPVTPIAKTHMPYRMDQARLDWYRELFIDVDYEVKRLPAYDPKLASNPFRTFRALPINSRYRFLLEESRFTIMNFIKGPVCRGQIALNVIDDHFWVMFANPREIDVDLDAEFLARESDNLGLPHPKTGTVIDIVRWRGYAKANARYQKARSELISKLLSEGQRLTIDSIWDGDGYNDNASLTVFRHFDTASVVKGMVGDIPKTAWVIDYPLLERIHYLLVAGFDVYGAVAHQLQSRLYMDFLRMEGEFNFLLFMPQEKRLAMHDYWYRDARKGYREHYIELNAMAAETIDIDYSTDAPKEEFLRIQRDRIYGAKAEHFSYQRKGAGAKIESALAALENKVGSHNSHMESVSFVNLIGENRDEFYTLLRNSAHSNIAEAFNEDERRLPEEDTMTVVSGFIGAYPNYFFQVEEQEIERFTSAVMALDSPADYQQLKRTYGVRRNAPWFWRVVDKAHAHSRWLNPVEYGIFDLSRYSGD